MVRGLAMVLVSGCMAGAGPTLAVRKDRVLLGFDADAMLELRADSSGKATPETHPVLFGIGTGLSSALGHLGDSPDGRVYGTTVIGLSPIKDVTAGGTVSASAGLITTQRTAAGEHPMFAAAGGGVMQGVDCEGYAVSAELGVRWTGHLELYLSAKINSAYEVGDRGTCPEALGGVGR